MTIKKKERPLQVNFAISAMEISGISLNRPEPMPATFETYVFNVAIEYRLLQPEKTILTTVKIEVLDTKTNFKAANLEVSYAFLLNNYSEIVTTDKQKKPVIPQVFLDVINSISLSTSRGVFYSEFKGTYLHYLVMPIIDPKLVNQMMRAK